MLAHARALLASTPEGRTAYLDADLRDPERILAAPELRDTLDLTQPVALSMIAIFHFIPDADDPYGILGRLLAALPSGSYLALTHATADVNPGMEQLFITYRSRGIPGQQRTRAEVERFFADLELIDPGVEMVHRWRPEEPAAEGEGPTDAEVSVYGGVARLG